MLLIPVAILFTCHSMAAVTNAMATDLLCLCNTRGVVDCTLPDGSVLPSRVRSDTMGTCSFQHGIRSKKKVPMCAAIMYPDEKDAFYSCSIGNQSIGGSLCVKQAILNVSVNYCQCDNKNMCNIELYNEGQKKKTLHTNSAKSDVSMPKKWTPSTAATSRVAKTKNQATEGSLMFSQLPEKVQNVSPGQPAVNLSGSERSDQLQAGWSAGGPASAEGAVQPGTETAQHMPRPGTKPIRHKYHHRHPVNVDRPQLTDSGNFPLPPPPPPPPPPPRHHENNFSRSTKNYLERSVEEPQVSHKLSVVPETHNANKTLHTQTSSVVACFSKSSISLHITLCFIFMAFVVQSRY